MKTASIFLALLVLAFSLSANATDLKGKTVIDFRAPVFAPLQHGSDFTFVGGSRQPFMMGWDFGVGIRKGISNRIMLGLNGKYMHTHDDTTGYENQGDEFTKLGNATVHLSGIGFGLEIQRYYEPVWFFQPYFLGGLGLDMWKVKNFDTEVSHKATDVNWKFGTGILVPLRESFALDFQIKYSREFANLSQDMPAGFYGPSTWEEFDNRPFKGYLEPSIALCFLFGGEIDSDHDGVVDAKDKCPETPKGVKVDKLGCPKDTDGDGVADYLDKCPGTPSGVAVNSDGCPKDSDGDGVADYLDKCPNTPAGVKVDANGCAPDSDGDGIPDQLDKCPDSPKGSAVNAEGCPKDSDSDGVTDDKDKAPGTPKGVKVDADGVPLAKKITEKITLNINYVPNSYEPDEKSKHQLDSIAERIIAWPDTKIEIRGFTDSRGKADMNQTLSQNRANGVMAYLVSKSVPADQMTAKGYGEDPKYFIGDNNTDAGRAKNRRTELESIK